MDKATQTDACPGELDNGIPMNRHNQGTAAGQDHQVAVSVENSETTPDEVARRSEEEDEGLARARARMDPLMYQLVRDWISEEAAAEMYPNGPPVPVPETEFSTRRSSRSTSSGSSSSC